MRLIKIKIPNLDKVLGKNKSKLIVNTGVS